MKKENPGAGNFAVDFDAQLHKVKANSRTQSFFLFQKESVSGARRVGAMADAAQAPGAAPLPWEQSSCLVSCSAAALSDTARELLVLHSAGARQIPACAAGPYKAACLG